MLKSNLKYFGLIILGVMLSATVTFAQPPEHAKEKMMQLKKMKLIEMLNLSEEKADKFIVRYGAAEKRLMEKGDEFENAINDMQKTLKEGKASSSDIKQKSDKLIQLQEEMGKAMTEKYTSVRSVLSDEEFAKLIVFEAKFREQMRHMLMNRGDGKPGRHEFMNKRDSDSLRAPGDKKMNKSKKYLLKKGTNEDNSQDFPEMPPPPEDME